MSHGKDAQQEQLGSECDHSCEAAASQRRGDGLRCPCGSLLARYVNGHIELKCRRCKRTVIMPVTPGPVGSEGSPGPSAGRSVREPNDP